MLSPGEISGSSRNSKVLFISHDASRTGAPLLLLNFLRWLKRQNRLEFEILIKYGGDLADEFRAVAPARILYGGIFPARPTYAGRVIRKVLPGVPVAKRLEKLYPAEAFPAIYSNTVTNGKLIKVFSESKRRIICHAHEMKMIMQRCDKETVETAGMVHRFIAVSEAVKHDLVETMKVAPGKISVVNGFGQPVTLDEAQLQKSRARMRAQLNIKESDVVTGMCGTPDWRKGADLFPLLAKAVKELAPKGGHKFVWIGTSADSFEYYQLAHDVEAMGLSDSIRFVHKMPNPVEAFSALDLFALTSREDPFPMVMLEAAALGLPVLCFEKSGGGPEFVAGGAGLALPYLDIPAMARAIVDLGNAPERRQAMGRVGKVQVGTRCSIESQGPKLLAVIEQVFGQLQ